MTLEEFRDRARRTASTTARLVPVWRDVLLESAPAGGETWARYTFMGTAPRAAWKLKDGVIQDWTAERGWHNDRRPSDPLADLEALLCDCEPIDVPEIGEFWSGAVGYF